MYRNYYKQFETVKAAVIWCLHQPDPVVAFDELVKANLDMGERVFASELLIESLKHI